jgi:hypothetical protein
MEKSRIGGLMDSWIVGILVRMILPMNRTRFSFERFSLTPALSRWERENRRQVV